MKLGKSLIVKLFCVIASIMCVSKAKASNVVEGLNDSSISNLKGQVQNNGGEYDVAWNLCCGGSNNSSSNSSNKIS